VNATETIYKIVDDIPLSDFDGVNDPVDPEMICAHTLAEALEERIRFYMENDPEMMKEFANAFLESVKWVDIADRKIEEWTDEQA